MSSPSSRQQRLQRRSRRLDLDSDAGGGFLCRSQEIEDLFECPICYESMMAETADSRVLPCQHAFCRGCIARWMAMSGTCPECRTPIGCLRADQLPPNVQLNRLRGCLVAMQQKQQPQHLGQHSCAAGAPWRHAETAGGAFCTALHEFSHGSADSRYLQLRPGDLIEILCRPSSVAASLCGGGVGSDSGGGWAYGRVGSRRGYFPVAYTRPVQAPMMLQQLNVAGSPASSTTCGPRPVVCALADWQPQIAAAASAGLLAASASADAGHQQQQRQVALLPLVRDRKYLVLGERENGWLHGRCPVTMATGLFPASYVARVHQLEPPPRRSRRPLSQPSAAAALFLSSASSSGETSSAAAVVAVTVAAAASSPAAAATKAPSGGGGGLLQALRNLLSPSSSGGASAGGNGGGGGGLCRGRRQQQPPRQQLDHQQQPQHSQLHHQMSLYRCTQSRPAATEAELHLSKGELVYVVSKRLDGWYRGFSVSTQKVGLFPGACVRSISEIR